MKLQVFEILMDDAEVNPQLVYKPGQTISFRVHLRLQKPMKCRSLKLKIKGDSNVHWTEQHSTGSGEHQRTETRHYRSHESYIDETADLFIPANSGPDKSMLPAGEWYYPGNYQLPHSLPSSFESAIGQIRYSVTAKIDKLWKRDDSTRLNFTVIRDLDLNLRSPDEVGEFSTEDDYKVKCCYCCSCCGKAHAVIRLHKRGLVPGESVLVTGEMRNTSRVNFDSSAIEVYQHNSYFAGGGTRVIPRIVSSTELQPLERGASIPIHHLLPIPALVASDLEGCGNINVKYYFRLYGNGGCCASLAKECCELIIGTIPIMTGLGVAAQYGMGSQQDQPGGAYPPPPSYEECHFGKVDMDANEGRSFGTTSNWAPSYPMYNMPQPSAPFGSPIA